MHWSHWVVVVAAVVFLLLVLAALLGDGVNLNL